ncbi:2-keto-4-pentenoate hydratase [Rhodococcus sp. HNM0563]|uniref:2-keto-4-pentenoate hydratase n=1 Tax=Rhodococcus sp. HNM0563 TaxID=2716339 RepID=UPI00146AD339|nr:fumarylacetoacetate hydrolase family protein [Rhodococcus sp. HNM0563]NLU65621.1 2-keto-4-pentenoate hydratase [Rhodococcus sp. HNM0563]
MYGKYGQADKVRRVKEEGRDSGHDIDESVRRLVAASATGIPCNPVREHLGSVNLEAAYLVQCEVNRQRIQRGGRTVGRKIGLTSASVQRQLGVSQPDFGTLFADMWYDTGDAIATARLLQPRVEAEVAFVLGADLVDGPMDLDQIRGSIESVTAALEVCDCRIIDWDISFSDTVADNAAAGLFVLGQTRRTLREVEPRSVTMSMMIDGQEVATGTGRDCMRDPLNAVVWLARTARTLGDPLRSGEVILSGALGPMADVQPGTRVTCYVSGLGSVSTRFY